MKTVSVEIPKDVYDAYDNEDQFIAAITRFTPLKGKKKGDTLSPNTPYGMLYRTYMGWKQQKRDMNFTRDQFISKFITKKKYVKMHKKYRGLLDHYKNFNDYKDRKKIYDREIKQIKPSFVFASDLDDIKIIKYSEVDRNNKKPINYYVVGEFVRSYDSVNEAVNDLLITPATIYKRMNKPTADYHFEYKDVK